MDNNQNKTAQKKPQKKQPRRITATYLENAALYYLQRYASSANNLKKVLNNKIRRSCTFHGDDPAPFAAVVDKLVERYATVGLIDDAVYAYGRVSSLSRQGRSKQDILAKLQIKGLSRAQIEHALDRIDGENGAPDNAEENAARAFTRKKKLGAFRTAATDDPHRQKQKDLAAMARAGFSYDIAARVIGATADEPFDAI